LCAIGNCISRVSKLQKEIVEASLLIGLPYYRLACGSHSNNNNDDDDDDNNNNNSSAAAATTTDISIGLITLQAFCF